MLEFFCYSQHNCFLVDAISTDSRQLYVYQRLATLYVRYKLHTGASKEKRNEADRILKFHFPL